MNSLVDLDSLRIIINMVGFSPNLRLVCKAFYQASPRPGCPYLKATLLKGVELLEPYTLRYLGNKACPSFRAILEPFSFARYWSKKELKVREFSCFTEVGNGLQVLHKGLYIRLGFSEATFIVEDLDLNDPKRSDIPNMVTQLVQNTQLD